MTLHLKSLEDQANILLDGAERGAHYLRGLANRQVCANTDALTELDFSLPEFGLPDTEVLDLIERVGSPGTTASAAGRYFGYVIGGSLPAASGARAMLTAWDQVADAPTGPSVIAMEAIATRWIVELLRLPPETDGAFTTGATMANVALLATARDELLARQGHARGKSLIGAPAIRVVTSAEIHATVLKSLRIVGLGSDVVERVPVDDQGRMRVDELPDLDDRTLVLAQAGNVCTGASDPFGEIASVCEATGAWLHIDGAFGLWARVSKKIGGGLDGLERADSWVVDSHKTLNAPYDSGIALCRHPDAMRASMAIGAAYLPPSDPGPADLAPEFSRAARGAETYAALLSLGRSGVPRLVDRLHSLAVRLATGIRQIGFEVPHNVHFNQVFATLPGDPQRCLEITNLVQESGEAWFGSATWQGQEGFRISVSNWTTNENDIDRLIAALALAADASDT